MNTHWMRLLIWTTPFQEGRQIKNMLQQRGLGIITVAQHRSEALTAIKQGAVDMIVLGHDIDSDVLADFMRFLRSPSIPHVARLPVVLMMNTPSRKTLQQGITLGIDHFVPRPVSAPKLILEMERMINKPVRQITCKSYLGPDRRRLPTNDFPGMERRQRVSA